MYRFFLIFVCIIAYNAVTAQERHPLNTQQQDVLKKTHRLTTTTAQPFTPQPPPNDHYFVPTNGFKASTKATKQAAGTTIGNTLYDSQSNNAMSRRILNDGNGNIHATWTMALQSNLADRGTGYNVSTDGGATWQEAPNSRLESIRTGFPSLGQTANGRIFSITHRATSANDPNGAYFTYKDAGSEEWQEVVLTGTNGTDEGGVWTRAATIGNTIHLIIGRSEGRFSGIEGGVAYFRSKDAGDNWDGPFDLDPALSDFLPENLSSAEYYDIDASENVVAMAFGHLTTPVVLYTSTDEGDTWQASFVQETNGYYDRVAQTFTDNNYGTQITSEGDISVLVDQNDQVHIWFDRFFSFASDDDGDGVPEGLSFFPASTGIMYWNENRTTPTLIGPTVQQDFNGDCDINYDNAVDVNEVPDRVDEQVYGNAAIGQSSVGMDAAGNLYLAYSAMRDDGVEIDGSVARLYRDVFVVKKMAGSDEWIGPYNVSNSATTEDVYPAIAKLVDEHVHLIYQSDDFTGIGATVPEQADHAITNNTIQYVRIPVDDIQNAAEDNSCPLGLIAANSFFDTTVENCTPSFGSFFDGHVIDHPDGDLTDEVAITLIDQVGNDGEVGVATPGDNIGDWTFTATDQGGNEWSDTLVFSEPNAISVLEDDIGPYIFPEPFRGFTTGSEGEIFFDTFFEIFDTVCVLLNTTYTDLGAIVVDPPGANFEAPYGNLYGCQPTLTTDNPVDVTTLGFYTVTYTATDLNGNTQVDPSTAEPIAGITRTVKVIEQDTEAPTIVLGADSNGDVDSVRVEVGTVTMWEDPGFLVFDNVDLVIPNEAVEVSITNKEGTIVAEVDVETTGTFTVTYTASDAAGNTDTENRVVIVADTQPPVISITPPPTVAVPCGTPYNDRGFTALDNVDGLISDQVVIGFVNLTTDDIIPEIPINCAGNYAVTYNVTDANGNAAAEVRRTVVVTGDCSDCPPPLPCPGIGITYTDGTQIVVDGEQRSLEGEFTVMSNGVDVTSQATVDDSNVNYNVMGDYIASITIDGCIIDISVSVVIIGIQDEWIRSTVNIYPNPSNGLIHIDAISLNEQPEPIQVTVFNILGEVVSNQQRLTAQQQSLTVNLEHAPAGVYFVQLTTTAGQFSQKIVLE